LIQQKRYWIHSKKS